jgi:osmoprotectant transport system ATP-binding protein
VTELLQLLRLDPETYRSKYPHQLSGGEQQRIGVARALAADPDLLLMDEPFAALDPVTRGALQGEIRRIQRATKKTVVFVTHDIEEALILASDIAIIERGRLAQWGTPLDLLEHPASAFVAEFVGGAASGLKLLSLRTVAERMHPGEHADGEPLASDASLRDALAAMAARRTDRLPVIDAAGRPVGAIALCDLVR